MGDWATPLCLQPSVVWVTSALALLGHYAKWFAPNTDGFGAPSLGDQSTFCIQCTPSPWRGQVWGAREDDLNDF